MNAARIFAQKRKRDKSLEFWLQANQIKESAITDGQMDQFEKFYESVE